MADTPDTLSTPELLILLREEHGLAVEYVTVWRGVTSGQIPSVRIGRQYFYRATDVPLIAAALEARALRNRSWIERRQPRPAA